MSTPEIHQLDPKTVERIAAGEVVERPASVVKELLENSIDAGASRVTVAVERGGTEGIRVSDDGSGMTREALTRAVEKHTTSKIRDIDDLESGVGTLGFRGEALHAIGAVSRTRITSRPRDGSQGSELTVEGGEITDVSPAGRPPGTTVEVQDLFYNVPARRKYLKQESTEFAHVNTVTTSYALANPDVAVTLEHDGRETFATNGTGDLRETVLSVYGREVAEAMRPIKTDTDDEEPSESPDGPLESVRGLVSHPETNRATRDYLTTFVNGRYVTASTVRDAVVDAYGTQLGPDRYPFAVIYLEVDPATVDVNVHPRKLEVRFADEEGVREQVRDAVETALLRDGLLRSSAPRGRSAPEETDIRPESQRDQQTTIEGSGEQVDAAETTAENSTGATTEPSAETAAESAAETSEEPAVETVAGSSAETPEAPSAETPEAPSTETSEVPSAGTTEGPSAEESAAETSEIPWTDETQETPTPEETGETSTPEEAGDSPDEQSQTQATPLRSRQARDRNRRKFQESGRQERLVEEDEEVTFENLPAMRILGQFRDTYIVAETATGLVLIDQHAADERINYERLKDSFAGETTTQALAEPVSLELTAREADLFEAHSDALSRLGFHANLVDNRQVQVRTVPAKVAESAGPELIRDVLSEFVHGADNAAETVEAAVDNLLADLACYPSVTGNTSLTEGSVVDLLSSLDECENPYACPHGRPVLVEFDTDEVDDRFERDYPGHG